jgi:predicted GIY-YIG superfamily endonuclease
MLFKKSLTDKCLPFPSLVTHDFWLGFVATCYSNIKYVKEPLVRYRQHNHNAISAFTRNAPKIKLTRAEKLKKIRERMKLLYEKCPEENIKEKEVFKIILESYQSFSLRNNWVRMTSFLKYRDLILAYKKKSELMKILFCLKLFFKID